jgi:hypothetical protein
MVENKKQEPIARDEKRRAKSCSFYASCSNPPLPPFSKGGLVGLLLIALSFMLCALCLAGCGYTLQSRTTLPFDSIQIEVIENKTLEPKLQDRLYKALTEEFLKHGVTVQPAAGYRLSGTINLFELNVLSERRGTAIQYEVVMRGDFRLVGPSGDTKDFKNIGSPFIVSFPALGMLEDVLASKELASERAVKDMAMEIVAALIYPVGKEDSNRKE